MADRKSIEEQLFQKQKQLDENLAQLKLVYNSESYKLGNLIIKPFTFLRWKK